MSQTNPPSLHLPSRHADPALGSPQSPSRTSPHELPPSTIISVSYAKFDTRLGNTIAYTYPPEVDVVSLVDAKSLQDYCFPDGAHGSMSDTICATLRRRTKSSPSLDREENSGDGVSQPRLAGHASYTNSFCAVGEGEPIFAFAVYHQKRDANADRGATQRGMLILTSQPLFHALQQLAKYLCLPFFDQVPMSEAAAHEMFARALFLSLVDTFCVKTGRAEWHVQAKSRVTEAVDCALDRRGTMLMAMDKHLCDQRVIRVKLQILRNDPVTDPHFVRRQPQLFNHAHPAGASLAHNHHNTTPSGQVDVGEGEEDVLFSSELVLPVPLPLNGASLSHQLAFGASLKQLMQWFGGKVALIHWCMLTRVPVMMIGDGAADVSEAVRACVLLMQPIDIDVVRFAPYCTLEHIDYFASNVSTSVYLALGATNAYVCHKDFPGAAKCDVRNGTVSFADTGSASPIKRMPKTHAKAFDDLCAAARDPTVAECYVRARCARFNMALVKQVLSARSGNYYDALCRVSNIVEQPLDASVRGTIRPVVREHNHRRGNDAAAAANSNSNGGGVTGSSSSNCFDRETTDSGFLLVEDEATQNAMRPSQQLPPTRVEVSMGSDVPPAAAATSLLDDGSPLASAVEESTSPLSPSNVEEIAANVVDEALATLDDAGASAPEQRRNKHLKELTTAIHMFEENSKRNHQLIVDVDVWYRDMCRAIQIIADDSEPWHQGMVDELSSFSALNELPPDPSLWYCPSELTGGCTAQQQWDRTQRLRIVQDYKERVFLLIDAVSKNNPRALFRKANRHMADFFQFPGAEGYALPTQVLLHSTGCKTVWYVQRTKVSVSGTMYLTKNYILFEAGSFAIRRRHQIIPFDCVRSVAKDRSSAFSTSVKILLDIPFTAQPPSVSGAGSGGDESGGAPRSPVTYHQGLLVVSDVHATEGFYQLLHALTHRQRRLMKLMESIPAPHCIPPGAVIAAAPNAVPMFVPRTIPVGLYSVQEQWFVDEVWENQRLYPLVGWSSKLLLNDPAAFSDFSCTRAFDKDAWRVPEGFQLVYDWRLAREAREIDSLLPVMSDERMLQYSKHPNPHQQQGSSSSRRRGGVAASVRAAVLSLSNHSSQLPPDPPAPAEAFNTTGDRSPRGARPQSQQTLVDAAAAAPAKLPPIEWLYSSSWASSTDCFRPESFLGGTMRRRLWVRVRKLIIPSPPVSEQGQLREEDRDAPLQDTSSTVLLRQRTLSTSSSDMVESPREIAVGVMTPDTVEGDEDS